MWREDGREDWKVVKDRVGRNRGDRRPRDKKMVMVELFGERKIQAF